MTTISAFPPTRRAAALVLGCVLAAALAGCGGKPSSAASANAIPIALKNHRFTPAEITVPANKPAVLKLTNGDGLAEEFDSSSLGVEKVVAGGQSGLVRIHPLAPGRYPFMGEYHSATAQGVVVAK